MQVNGFFIHLDGENTERAMTHQSRKRGPGYGEEPCGFDVEAGSRSEGQRELGVDSVGSNGTAQDTLRRHRGGPAE